MCMYIGMNTYIHVCICTCIYVCGTQIVKRPSEGIAPRTVQGA